MAERKNRDKLPPPDRVIHKALAIFEEKKDFDRFLAKHDFIKNLSVLSYLEPVEENEGHYVCHLYFYGHGNRLTTMKNTFSYGEFKNDPDLKRNCFDETNELSIYIRDYKQQNGISEEIKIKRVIQPKKPPVPVPQMQILPPQTEMAESHIEESLKKRLDSLSEEDVKQGLGVKLKRCKNLTDVCESQRQEIQQLRQDRQDLRIIVQDLLRLIPSKEAQTVEEQLKLMDNIYQRVQTLEYEPVSRFNAMDFIDNDQPNANGIDSISNFFAKGNDHANSGLLGTSPVLVSTCGVVGGGGGDHPSAMDSVMEEEKVEVEVDKEKEATAEQLLGFEEEKEEEKEEKENLYATPPDSPPRTTTPLPPSLQHRQKPNEQNTPLRK